MAERRRPASTAKSPRYAAAVSGRPKARGESGNHMRPDPLRVKEVSARGGRVPPSPSHERGGAATVATKRSVPMTPPHSPRDEGEATMEATLARMIAAGQPPRAEVVVENDDALEVVVFESIEWALCAVYLERHRLRVGKVTGIVANQSTRQIFIHGPGLPPWGVGLQITKAGFRQSIYKLEDVIRKTGVPFNFHIECVPSAGTPIDQLLKRKVAPGELPKCMHRMDAITTLIAKFAEAKQDRGSAQLKAVREQLRAEGIGMDQAAEVWFTKDGRSGVIPWVEPTDAVKGGGMGVRGRVDSPSPLSMMGGTRPGGWGTSSSGVDLTRDIIPSESGGCTLASPMLRDDATAQSVGGAARRARAGSTRSSAPPAAAAAAADAAPGRARNIVSLLPNAGGADTTAPLVAPCVLHIPPGQPVVLDPEPGLRPLRILLHEGGRVLNDFKYGMQMMQQAGDLLVEDH